MDEREARLPAWARELIADLRKKVQYGNEPLIKELSILRPKVERLERINGAMTDLLRCAASGDHKGAVEIVAILESYSLTVTPNE